MTYELLPTLFIAVIVLYALLIRCIFSISADMLKHIRYRKVIALKLRTIAKKTSIFLLIVSFSFALHQIKFNPEFNLSNSLSVLILLCFALYCVLNILTVHEIQLEISEKVMHEQSEQERLSRKSIANSAP